MWLFQQHTSVSGRHLKETLFNNCTVGFGDALNTICFWWAVGVTMLFCWDRVAQVSNKCDQPLTWRIVVIGRSSQCNKYLFCSRPLGCPLCFFCQGCLDIEYLSIAAMGDGPGFKISKSIIIRGDPIMLLGQARGLKIMASNSSPVASWTNGLHAKGQWSLQALMGHGPIRHMDPTETNDPTPSNKNMEWQDFWTSRASPSYIDMYTYIYIHIWCTALKPADTQAPCAVNNQPASVSPLQKKQHIWTTSWHKHWDCWPKVTLSDALSWGNGTRNYLDMKVMIISINTYKHTQIQYHMDQVLLLLGVTGSGFKATLGRAGSPAHHSDWISVFTTNDTSLRRAWRAAKQREEWWVC